MSKSNSARIFLVGPMGVGKTTVGTQLARRLGKTFYDSDHVIEERTGADIPLIFELEGEQGFRDRESRIIDELSELPDLVLATGGGAVLRAENRHHLAARGFVVYLHATLELLVERTRRSRNRPLLQVDDPRARLRAILEERDPLYREVADTVVDTGRRSAKHVVNELLRQLQKFTATGAS